MKPIGMLKVLAMGVAFGFGSVYSNRGHGELASYLIDQSYERLSDDDPGPDLLVVVALPGQESTLRI